MKRLVTEPGLKCNIDFRGRGRLDKQLSKSLACPGLANCMLVSVNDFNLEDKLPIGP